MNWYAVFGRVPYKDEECHIFRCESTRAAKDLFVEAMRGGRSDAELAEIDEHKGTYGGTYIITIVVSETRMWERQ